MNEYIQANLEWLKDLVPEKCSFFLWTYPNSAPFDRVQPTLTAYRNRDLSVRLGFPGIAESVISQIRDKSELHQFLIVGNSLGAGIVLWDYEKLAKDATLSFLLISPTEAFLPPTGSIVPLKRTTLLAIKGYETGNGDERYSTDPWIRGKEAWQWLTANRDDTWGDLITASNSGSPEEITANGATIVKPTDFTSGHKTIGSEINAELLSKLIRVKLGLAEKSILAEPPRQR